MADPGEVTVKLQFDSKPANGAGGQREAWSDVATGLAGRLRNPSPRPGYNTEIGPGTQYRTEKVLVFDQPFGVMTTQDYSAWRFVTADGSLYRLIERNDYEMTVQFSVELVA